MTAHRRTLARVSIILFFMVARGPAAIANSNPVPQTTSQAISIAQVKRLCLPTFIHTAKLSEWNFVGGYLLCDWTDGFTGGVSLYKQTAVGNLVLIDRDGGGFSVYDLTKWDHVPLPTAKKLSDGLHP